MLMQMSGFRWTLLSWRHTVERNSTRVNRLQQYHTEFHLTGFETPIKITDIQTSITIHVYSWDEQTGLFPVHCSDN